MILPIIARLIFRNGGWLARKIDKTEILVNKEGEVGFLREKLLTSLKRKAGLIGAVLTQLEDPLRMEPVESLATQ